MTDQPLGLSIAEVVEVYPRFQVAFAVVRGVRTTVGPCPNIENLMAEAEHAAGALLDGQEIAELPEILAWRTAYRAFGSKKTSYRNSCEALLRRLRNGAPLPRVLPLVDLYNALSVKYLVPAGADDLAQLAPPMAFRYARPGDSFLDLARDPPADDPPFAGEVVYADQEKCLCRRWNWRQDARSRIRPETRDAAFVIQTLAPDGAERLAAAAEELAGIAAKDLGAACEWTIASTAQPEIAVPPG